MNLHVIIFLLFNMAVGYKIYRSFTINFYDRKSRLSLQEFVYNFTPIHIVYFVEQNTEDIVHFKVGSVSVKLSTAARIE